MATTLLDARKDLAAALRAVLPDSVLVYAYPAETVALPCMVIVPDEPYWVPASFGKGPTDGRMRINFEVQIITVRGDGEAILDNLEELMVAAGVGLTTDPTFRWVDSSQPTQIEVNEIPCVMAAIACYALV